jgi:hypothetical protein
MTETDIIHTGIITPIDALDVKNEQMAALKGLISW